MVICLEQGANDLHMVQLMPLPPHHLLLQLNPEWFTFLVPAYPGLPGKRPMNGCSSSSTQRENSPTDLNVSEFNLVFSLALLQALTDLGAYLTTFQ